MTFFKKFKVFYNGLKTTANTTIISITVGTSFITTELSSSLSMQGSDTILVDHQYASTNIDVLLGLKSFRAQHLDEFSTPLHEMDVDGALSFLSEVRKNLRLLAVGGDLSEVDTLNYTQALCHLLSRILWEWRPEIASRHPEIPIHSTLSTTLCKTHLPQSLGRR